MWHKLSSQPNCSQHESGGNVKLTIRSWCAKGAWSILQQCRSLRRDVEAETEHMVVSFVPFVKYLPLMLIQLTWAFKELNHWPSLPGQQVSYIRVWHFSLSTRHGETETIKAVQMSANWSREYWINNAARLTEGFLAYLSTFGFLRANVYSYIPIVVTRRVKRVY